MAKKTVRASELTQDPANAVQSVEPVTDGGIESIAESIHEATEVHLVPG